MLNFTEHFLEKEKSFGRDAISSDEEDNFEPLATMQLPPAPQAFLDYVTRFNWVSWTLVFASR